MVARVPDIDQCKTLCTGCVLATVGEPGIYVYSSMYIRETTEQWCNCTVKEHIQCLDKEFRCCDEECGVHCKEVFQALEQWIRNF